MPPKVKITKEEIINTAVDIVRNSGAQAINARTISAILKCSTQPIFFNFENMEELKLAVIKKAAELCKEYMQREAESGEFPIYKANGMAYIRFAKEESELFKLLYMRQRSGEATFEETSLNNQMEQIVHNNTGLSVADTRLFHLEMWAYVHGIAVMVATGYIELDWELIGKMLTDSYQGLRKHYGME